MKHFAIPLLAGMVLFCAHAQAQKVEFKEQITKEFSPANGAAGSTLVIYNINGNIKVEGYNGNKVILQMNKTISARNNEILQAGKNEFKVDFTQTADSIIVYISDPFDSRPNRNQNWNHGEKRKIEYNYNLDFTIKVPYETNLRASTINGGDVIVHDVTGAMHVSNINGAIRLTNAKGVSKVSTINGNVEANYVAVPAGESEFKTLNGDIKITYPPTFAADCLFKTFRGEFYTDFPNIEKLPVRVVKNTDNKNEKTIYKLDTETSIRFGNGGKNFRFETFNGNIYIKKQS